MENITLEVKVRDKNEQKPNALRRQGMIPAVLYGRETESQNLVVDAKTFEKVYKQAGASTLVDLQIEGKEPIKVLIQDVAKHHITLKPIHADFYQVSMTEKLTATVPLKFINEAPAVKEFSGTLLKNVQEVEVECLPTDLVSEIEVDLSPLKTFNDGISIKDINVPSGITILNNSEDNVVFVQAPRVEEEEVIPSEEEQIEDIEKEGEKKEGDEEKKDEKEGEKKEEKEEKKEEKKDK